MDILDTDILIDVQRGHPPALAWFAQLTELPSVPGYVAMALVQAARNKQEVDDSLNLIAPLPIVWPSAVDCDRALSEFAAYPSVSRTRSHRCSHRRMHRGPFGHTLHMQRQALPPSPRPHDPATLHALAIAPPSTASSNPKTRPSPSKPPTAPPKPSANASASNSPPSDRQHPGVCPLFLL
jgi:hypothetical protein